MYDSCVVIWARAICNGLPKTRNKNQGPYTIPVLGPWSLVLGPVHVPCAWFLVPGPWSLGPSPLVPGPGPWSWSMVLVLGLWSLWRPVLAEFV